ncbi:exported hypothetical protein [uncultured Desulfobacterium sp.]|uniref:Uncharacterized protein n=1 Tax=uncultured Desulfobacterium sp. TaxID=201089 RepID=A0A445N0U0_9BACT|nr:exported hypothetical protein [uncultured Desulfobacterium sp.]
MKSVLFFLSAALVSFCFTMPVQAYRVSFDEHPTSYYAYPITEEYSSLGIHFKSGAATPQLPGITSLYGGTVFDATSWPNSVFPVLPPASQYLGLDKPQGETVITGIAIQFDNFSTQLGFEYRRPGNNLYTYTDVSIYMFNTESSTTDPVYGDQIRAYVDPSKNNIADDDGWLPYLKKGLPEFNLVVFFADKKFAVDNLSYGEDKDGDGVADDEDKCLNTPEGEVADASGCSASERDTDGDGHMDDKDICPDTPANEIESVDVNGCSPSQLDTDDDGFNNDVDNCPTVSNPDQADSDADGIGDVCDNCLSEYNPGQQDLDGDGHGNACDTPDKASLTCLASKVKESANLCKAIVACGLKDIKDSLKNIDSFGQCVEVKALPKFENKWSNAEKKKIKGIEVPCETIDSQAIKENIYNALVNIYDIIVPDENMIDDKEEKDSNKLAQALLKAAGNKCVSMLKAESANIKKSDEGKLTSAKIKADTTFENAWSNALKKAKKDPADYNIAKGQIEEIIDQLVKDISGM